MANNDVFKVDVSQYVKMNLATQKAVHDAILLSLQKGVQDLHKETVKNVTGPRYGVTSGPLGGQDFNRGALTNAGKLPIPRQTGTLKRSIRHTFLTKWLAAVFADESIANYAGYVHDGTKKMKPRRYLADAVKSRTQYIINQVKYNVSLAIKNSGLHF